MPPQISVWWTEGLEAALCFLVAEARQTDLAIDPNRQMPQKWPWVRFGCFPLDPRVYYFMLWPAPTSKTRRAELVCLKT